MISHLAPSAPQPTRGFTLPELLATISAITLLAWLAAPAFSSSKGHSQRGIDLNNVRQIMVAANLYANSNNDHLPHPGWGSIENGSGAGPDNWAYATRNLSRLPGHPAFIPTAAGRTSNTNQIPFFRIGQLGSYLEYPRILECPKDVTDRTAGLNLSLYRARAAKLSSYTMNGAVSGYGGIQVGNAALGGTYKVHAFNGTDILLWEKDESSPFNFNDLGSNPLNLNEGVSFRHSSAGANPGVRVGGEAIVGQLDTSAKFLPLQQVRGFMGERSPRPNPILCGPGYR
ncbi:MAG TPA: prepilin-type N-terminal cleavage/methylation domain-containing protein [Methylomirabilota bacterium]|nr:prepilin-type N-terminal cleavage/methylation domain-containing protein [Methylomirabilota bacterium]